MIRPLLTLLVTIIALAASSCAAPARATDRERPSVVLPAEMAYPNGVAVASDGTLYVGQITAGSIHRRSPGGDWSTVHPGSPGVFAATTLRLDEPRALLWGASPDFLPQGEPRTPNIFAIDTTSNRVVHTVPLASGFPNDIAVEPQGSVLITDSTNGRVLRYRPDNGTFATVVQDPRLTHDSGIGVGGIARSSGGDIVVGNYSSGLLYVLSPTGLRKIALPRPLENPDGIAFTADGSLIALEGAVHSGAGTVLQIREPLQLGPREITTLAEGLESPVNLSIAVDGNAYVSESRIRHRLVDDLASQPAPDDFRLMVIKTN
ncbi:Vgb family protein [Mycolicibacterium sp. XJ870]